MAKRPHLLLKNPQGVVETFNKVRYVDPNPAVARDPAAYRNQKQRLSLSYRSFVAERTERLGGRLLDVPAHIECIEVDFLTIFSDNEPFRTKSAFENKFGLVPLIYSNFNKSVLFAIVNQKKFLDFVSLLEAFVHSSDQTHPTHTPYAIITLIYDFRFLSSSRILDFCKDDVVLSMVNNNAVIDKQYSAIQDGLFKYLKQLREQNQINDFNSDGISSIEIKGISPEDLKLLADNFDIIYKAQSLRSSIIKPDSFNSVHLTWDLEILPPDHNQVIAVLDNGVRPIRPLEEIVITDGYDLTGDPNPDACRASHSHGTVVASLAAVGMELFNTDNKQLIADARILPVKILSSFEGTFNVYDIIAVMRDLAYKGVRIFNLSVCGTGKSYNSVNSIFAYLLDKLSYELDILIFIAAGNLNEDDIQNMHNAENAGHPFHQYPNHFYDPEAISDAHNCEATNICIPAESLNNITVGAIAENYRAETASHLTLSKELPAFYTRKHHIDYLAKINGSNFTKNQINRNINKPDIVMPGGDRMNSGSAMQVLGFGDRGTDFYNFDAGTSLAAPLAANLAAKVLNIYPDLNMQSVKALLINSAERAANASFLDQLILKVKERLSHEIYDTSLNRLSGAQRGQITKKINSDNLYRNIAGYGTPDSQKLLYSGDKSVTIILQDSIERETHTAIPINIPEYLLQGNASKRLKIKATLCFKTFPEWGNQLGYNPLHISFNLAKSVALNDPDKGAAIVADREHTYFDPFYNTEEILSETDDKKQKELKRIARKKALGIKDKIYPWSEDFFPAVNKPFSNTQQLNLNIQKDEIEKVSKQIILVVRCVLKPNLDPAIEAWKQQQQSHPFSLVINIEEDTNEFRDTSLYDELLACNTLEVTGNLSADLDIIAEAEAS